MQIVSGIWRHKLAHDYIHSWAADGVEDSDNCTFLIKSKNIFFSNDYSIIFAP